MKASASIGYAAALIAGTAMAASHPSFLTHKQAQLFVTGAPPGSKTLYDQNRDPAGASVFSEHFGSGYDTQGADDFAVPAGHTWVVKEVDVTGVYFNGSGPASSENVFFYRDRGGLPGGLVVSCPNQNGGDNGTGSLAIVLSDTCRAKLHGGKTYWVSVQANVDVNTQWGWSVSADTSGEQAAWQNPGGDVCPTWGHLKDCLGVDGDLMFALRGKDKH